ncbi:hypothetical protein C8R43DRAFT_881342, partial [Mycena crocata]
MVQSLTVALPDDPKEAWSDHVSLTLKLDREILTKAPQPLPKIVRQPPVLPQGDPYIDELCENAMGSKQTPIEMLRNLYGKVYVETQFLHVYVQGSCKATGTKGARAVSAVFWGETSTRNCVQPVPGPEPPTTNRAAVYAVLLAVKAADPNISLMIFTSSEYIIRHACYSAGKNSQLGWICSNGDLLRDLTELLSRRAAPTRFTRVE